MKTRRLKVASTYNMNMIDRVGCESFIAPGVQNRPVWEATVTSDGAMCAEHPVGKSGNSDWFLMSNSKYNSGCLRELFFHIVTVQSEFTVQIIGFFLFWI